MNDLAELLQREKELAEAEALYRANLEALERRGMGKTNQAQMTRRNLASVLDDLRN